MKTMKDNKHQKICSHLISDLTERQKEIISRRFGLGTEKRETLESIGRDSGICRERVRQIQQVSLNKIRLKADRYKKVFESFVQHFKKHGSLRKEDILLAELGADEQNEIYFLLSIREPFQKFNENDDFYSLWTINHNSLQLAKKNVSSLYAQLKKEGEPVSLKNLNLSLSLKRKVLISYLDISKKIHKNQENLYGLSVWPEINPRGVKDRAYLAFKKTGKPLHFTEAANLIENSHLQTVHNELIKDPRFILVGRGIYALSEWGYYPGQVKDVILKILQEAKAPLTKQEILEEVFKQRIVKENTILLNLSNKKHFFRDSKGKYSIREI